MNSSPHIRFIFHIGAGKTGTSSIQATLKKSIHELSKNGIWYLGLMFEHAPVKLFDWQVFGGQDEFLALPSPQAEREFRRLLRVTLRRAQAAGVHTLIWSSESFFDRYETVLKPLGEIVGEVDLSILCYVRRHDRWARSAYIQWGIKHKTYPGPLKTFRDWIALRKPLFAPTLQRYAAAFPGRINVRNYDAVNDVVADFLSFCSLEKLRIEPVNENISPDDTELLLRALFNNMQKHEALPMLFNEKLGQVAKLQDTTLGYLEGLYPTIDDMKQLSIDTMKDQGDINAMLVQQGQAPLPSCGDYTVKAPQVDDGVLLMGLTRLAMAQAKRLEQLDTRVKNFPAS